MRAQGRHTLRVLVGLIALGTAIRLAFAFGTNGDRFDLQSFDLVGGFLHDGHPLDVYSQATADPPLVRWPYPPVFFPVIYLVRGIAENSPLAIDDLIRVVFIAVDALLAWLVFKLLLLRDGSDRRALTGAALVALGPSLIAVSGYHGQLDTLAWLPVVAALYVWEGGGSRRGLYAGLLVGLAAGLKTVPIVAVLALLPTARSRREQLTAMVAAAAVPLAFFLPFVLADASGVADAVDYRGLPGFGGLSLLVQPDLAVAWLSHTQPTSTALTDRLQDLNVVFVAVSVLATAAVCWRAKTPAPRAALMLVLAVAVAGVNFNVTYAAWIAILLIAAGLLREALLLQAWMLVPTVLAKLSREIDGGLPEWLVRWVYVPMMIAVLLAFTIGWVRLGLAELSRARPARGSAEVPIVPSRGS
ncbi:MAG: hypothetical protein QOH90_2292 [Actinomycetota bacterium]|nr:hypothetical protein [Actinomycetota bacterium]